MTSTVISRREWGARGPAGPIPTINPEGVTLHYNGPTIGGFPWNAGRSAQLVRAAQAFHQDARGWADIAYNAVVDHEGRIYEGRPPRARSAAQGTNEGNARSLAVMVLVGQGEPLTEAARHAVLDYCAMAGVPLRWVHSDWHSTACPGDPCRAWKAEGFRRPGPTGPAPLPPRVLPTIPPPVRPTLRLGDRGRMVGMLQLELLTVAPPFARPDGIYGPATADKVRGLQAMFGLTADGIAGPATWRVVDFLYAVKTGEAPPR